MLFIWLNIIFDTKNFLNNCNSITNLFDDYLTEYKKMSEENNLPKGWQIKRLGEIFTIERGGSPRPIEDFITNAENGINWIKIGDTKNVVKYILHTKEKIKPEGMKRSRMVYKDDFILSNSMSFGKPFIMKTTGGIHDGWLVIRKNEIIDNNYLFYILSSPLVYQQFSNLAKGSTVKNLNIEAVKQVVIKFPGLIVQRAIVSKIEELLSDLENGKQQLLIAQQQLKVYRQSLLKWAFEGRFDFAQRPGDSGQDGALPKGWKWVKIEDIATVGTGSTPLKGNNEYYYNGKIAWVTSGALNNEYVNEATDYVTEKALKETNLSIYPKNTLLLAMYGEGKTRGKCSELKIEATTNQAIAAIQFKNHDIRVKPFLKYFLLKNYTDIRRLSSGGVQPNLNLGIVKKTLLPFPPLAEQQFIVDELESKLTVCDKIEETITQSLQQAETLRQSILKKAFEGKLVNVNESMSVA